MEVNTMPNRIATFEKVSYTEFKTSILKLIDSTVKDDIIRDMYDNIKLPIRATSGSAGYDFFAPFSFTTTAGDSVIIPTGIRCKIDEGWYLGCYPRSSLGFKYRMALDNTVGIIDSDYYYSENEGHIMLKLHSAKNITVDEGKAFAQGIFTQYGITTDDDVTETRNGGFGSTDKK